MRSRCAEDPVLLCRGEHDEERVLEASFQRERERERKEAEARLQEQDNAYKTALRKWEAQER